MPISVRDRLPAAAIAAGALALTLGAALVVNWGGHPQGVAAPPAGTVRNGHTSVGE